MPVSTPERPLQGIHFIVSGEVRVSDHRQLDIARSGLVLDRGDSFGEYSIVGAQPFPSQIDTLTDLQTQFLPRSSTSPPPRTRSRGCDGW